MSLLASLEDVILIFHATVTSHEHDVGAIGTIARQTGITSATNVVTRRPPMPKAYLWHGLRCTLLVRAPYKRGVKRNCLIQLDEGRKIVPCRALRRLTPDRLVYLAGVEQFCDRVQAALGVPR